jgi:hypothetical protein
VGVGVEDRVLPDSTPILYVSRVAFLHQSISAVWCGVVRCGVRYDLK